MNKQETSMHILKGIVDRLIKSYGEDAVVAFIIENEAYIFDKWYEELGEWNSIIEEGDNNE